MNDLAVGEHLAETVRAEPRLAFASETNDNQANAVGIVHDVGEEFTLSLKAFQSPAQTV